MLLPAWAGLVLLQARDERPWLVLWCHGAGVGRRHRRLLCRPCASVASELAPEVSPGKTLEGLAGGVLAPALVSVGDPRRCRRLRRRCPRLADRRQRRRDRRLGGGRPDGEPGQAGGGREGQRRPAAGPRRHPRPGRRRARGGAGGRGGADGPGRGPARLAGTVVRMRSRVTILGATGSIGLSTLDVLERHPQRYEVFALTAHHRIDELADLCRRHRPAMAVVASADDAARLADLLAGGEPLPEILHGAEGLAAVAAHPEVDQVMAAIVGSAGLEPTLAAARAGKRVLLANKEALVMAGRVFMDAVAAQRRDPAAHRQRAQRHLPVHAGGLSPRAPGARACARLLLTASGGPFRTRAPASLATVTPEQACAHPNWSMGRKISVDSATMMNKGLELIEACWLFDVDPDEVRIVVHPQSVIHSMVEYLDGSVLAQLGQPDMRTPIAHALAWPERIDAGVASLDLIARASLDFEAPDDRRFPCLRLAAEAAAAGGRAPAVLNAANEVAVAAFLDGRIGYPAIPAIIESVLAAAGNGPASCLDDVLDADRDARERAGNLLTRHAV
ncbi:MAG: 1-deoxy-D-xylulose-5-phosphate reductoisomerase [Gammaproteobacteria bacterium]|nr:1-deoxy-D-xylulose-5-phosphate reductoisomerase [Gammaproteobacteria bacterium]